LIRGQFAWVGFKTIAFSFERPARPKSHSKVAQLPELRAVTMSTQFVFAYAFVLLFMICLVGAILSFLSLLAALLFIFVWIAYGVPFVGFRAIIASIVLGFSLELLCIGFLTLYLAAVHDSVKNQPLYI
jgi:hypothetical protein